VYEMPERAGAAYRKTSDGRSNRVFREICHDMRQPVAGVLALAAAALDEPQVPPAALARLRLIVEQAEWLAQIISDGLEAGVPAREPAHRSDARQAVTEAVASARPLWPGEIALIAPAKAIYITVHPVILRRSIANLLDNAIRAAGSQGNVRVTAGSCPGWALIAIEDDGPGFGRIERGHGLGLSAVTRIVIKHGGRVECTRSSLGGTCVSLWLPMAPDPADGGRAWRLWPMSSRPARSLSRAAHLATAIIRPGALAGQRRLEPHPPPGGRLRMVPEDHQGGRQE
jgi:signal transduction histidine kinase